MINSMYKIEFDSKSNKYDIVVGTIMDDGETQNHIVESFDSIAQAENYIKEEFLK